MNIKCLFGFHKYKELKRQDYFDTSYGDGVDMCRIYCICTRCNKRNKSLVYGHWEDLE